MSLDPCNCFNPGISRTSKCMGWGSNQRREVHDVGSVAVSDTLRGTRQGAAHKVASIQSTSALRHTDRLLLRLALARLTFSRMSLAFAVQIKGLGENAFLESFDAG